MSDEQAKDQDLGGTVALEDGAGLGGTVMLDTPDSSEAPTVPKPAPTPSPAPPAAVPPAMFDMSAAEPPTMPSATPPPPDETRAPAARPADSRTETASQIPSPKADSPASPPKSQPVAKVEIAKRARAAPRTAATTSSTTTRDATKPPALAPAAAPPDRAPDETRVPTQRPKAKPGNDTSRWILAGVLSTAAALVLGYVIVRERTRAEPPTLPNATASAGHPRPGAVSAPPAPPKPAPAAPTAAPTESADVAPIAPAPSRAADLAACVSQSMSLGPAVDGAALGFLCEQTDAKSAARDMTTLVAASAEVPGDTRRRWAGLGWFQMGTAQVLRARCCGDVSPMVGPQHLQACGLDAALAALDGAALAGDLSAPAKTYLDAVDCLFKANTARLFGQRRRPNAAEQGGMIELLSK